MGAFSLLLLAMYYKKVRDLVKSRQFCTKKEKLILKFHIFEGFPVMEEPTDT